MHAQSIWLVAAVVQSISMVIMVLWWLPYIYIYI